MALFGVQCDEEQLSSLRFFVSYYFHVLDRGIPCFIPHLRKLLKVKIEARHGRVFVFRYPGTPEYFIVR